jgi:superfamily II DNA or RNA helicase
MKTLRPYQENVVKTGIEHNLLMGLQCGLGKSLISIEIAKHTFSVCNAPCIVVAPKGVRAQWVEFIKEQDTNAKIWVGSNDIFDYKTKIADLDYLVLHYEAAVKFIDTLMKYQFSTFILDECHRIKSRKALRTIAIKKLKATKRLALSGTPYDRDPSELYSILNFLEPKTFKSYWAFFDTHVQYDTDYLGYKKNLRVKDAAALATVLRPHAIFMKKSQVMPELPSLQISYVPIELGVTQRRTYDAIKNVKDMEIVFEDLSEPMFIQHALTKLVRLLQCASDPQGLGLTTIPSAKLEWLADWCADNPHESVLIFSRYRKTAQRAAKLVGADALIMGGSPRKSVPVASKPLAECTRIVATIAAAAEGFDFGHLNTAIYLDRDYSSILMQQSMERIDRGNNTVAKQVIFLDAVDTVDLLVRQALDFKWDTKKLIDSFLAMEQNHDVSRVV